MHLPAILQIRATGDVFDTISHISMPKIKLVVRSSGSSGSKCGPNACEKPTSSSTFTLPIILGVAVPLLGAAILFIILQRRHSRKQREEDENDRHASLDFGLGDVPHPGRPKKESASSMVEEKSGLSRRQVSMDMNLTNPYLLSLEMKSSRDSMKSLSRSLHQEDPYRPVSEFVTNDTASSRPHSKSESSGFSGRQALPRPDIMTESSSYASQGRKINQTSNAFAPPRQNSLVSFPPTINLEQVNYNPTPYEPPSEPPQAYLSSSGSALSKDGFVTAQPVNNNQFQQNIFLTQPTQGFAPNAVDTIVHNPNVAIQQTFDPNYGFNSAQTSYISDQAQITRPKQDIPEIRTVPQPIIQNNYTCFTRNTDTNIPETYSHSLNPEFMNQQQQFVVNNNQNIPQVRMGNFDMNSNRISILSRPLPPENITETDDPEIRANRIRSFYKEYFDDSTPAPIGQYYESSKKSQYDETTLFDQQSNQFILPYTQPISRRAMTPPPGNTFLEPTRHRNGSVGAMSFNDVRNEPVFFSPGPRPQSSASGRQLPIIKKPMPAPAILNPLPNPAKLKSDNFTMNSIEFAPPSSYRDRAGSRPDNPFSDLKQFSPINNSMNELSPIPSPKSGAYSTLDFAPPKKFRDCDNNSDAGSIRSYRSNKSGKYSGCSGSNVNGSHLVDQLPEDVSFTKNGISNALKPQWDMNR